jgi:transposase
MTRILAIDLGKFKSVACLYERDGTSATYRAIPTSPSAIHDVLVELEPDRLVIEICGIAGWIHDLAVDLGVAVEVANPQHEGWRWNKVKRKTDRGDALKLARLSAMRQLPTVYMPARRVRQWKSLIAYRHTLVDRRTAIKNTIRALLDVQGLRMPSGARGWSAESLKRLLTLTCSIGRCGRDDLWRGQLHSELTALGQVNGLLEKIERRLDRIAAGDERVQRLQSMPGVGNRLSELVVATLDRAERFRSAREVSAYVGLVPRQFESGTMSRQGRISKQGPSLLRRLLVQIAWGMEQRSPYVARLFERISGGHKTRRKRAAVAVARKILVWCWAMLRDGTRWRDPSPVTA